MELTVTEDITAVELARKILGITTKDVNTLNGTVLALQFLGLERFNYSFELDATTTSLPVNK